VPLVRVQEIEQGLVKRVLDIGAEGILVPQVRGPEDVARAVAFAKYPPEGVRGIGAERATRWGMAIPSYTRVANRNTLVIPIIETVEAADSLEAILAVPGVDALFFGPYDYAASAGFLGVWNAPAVMPRILAMARAARARGVPCGILTPGEPEARLRRRQGFQLLALGFDTMLLIRGVERMLAAAGRPLRPEAWHD
jgi:2-keto-3-deoxy-L-rhamnonate aldolase RhmA